MDILQNGDRVDMVLDRAADEASDLAWYADDGSLIDLSAYRVRFIVKSLPDLTFEPGPHTDPKMRLIEFDQSFTAKLGSKPREYRIEAVHSDQKTTTLAYGSLSAKGWVA